MNKISGLHGADDYRKRFPRRPPNRDRIKNLDETKELGSLDGVVDFPIAPFDGSQTGAPPDEADRFGANRYLWIIGPAVVPVVIEECPAARRLESGRITHTNLSGGKDAHCGGELWFRDEGSFWLSGASGRYPPRSRDELAAVAEIFRVGGYQVNDLGWDDGIPARFLRSAGEWR